MTYLNPQWFEIFLLHWKEELLIAREVGWNEKNVTRAIEQTNDVYTILLADKVEKKLEEK